MEGKGTFTLGAENKYYIIFVWSLNDINPYFYFWLGTFIFSSKEGYKLVLDADRIEFCCRWLYTPREDDGKSRVLFLSAFSKITAISLFIERIKKVSFSLKN